MSWRDADTERFAALLTDYCLDVQPGQQVLVRSTTLAAPLLRALHARDPRARRVAAAARRAAGRRGGLLRARARPRTSTRSARSREAEAAQADAFLTIQAPLNTRALADVDPARIARIAARARR